MWQYDWNSWQNNPRMTVTHLYTIWVTFSGLKVILLSKAAFLMVAKQQWLKGILHGNQWHHTGWGFTIKLIAPYCWLCYNSFTFNFWEFILTVRMHGQVWLVITPLLQPPFLLTPPDNFCCVPLVILHALTVLVKLFAFRKFYEKVDHKLVSSSAVESWKWFYHEVRMACKPKLLTNTRPRPWEE